MKTLRKALCLVLALAMMAGTLAVAASASSFADDADITYKEAVDVLTSIGVINGVDNNKFDPTGTLTREQAAKIICYLLLGKTNAEKLAKSGSNFTDVADGRWSAGYIAYCVSEDIIAGVGGGKFNPTGTLTGLAFGKMLLCALGYDAAVEGFVDNAYWGTNVQKKITKLGLDAGISGADLGKAISREVACQLAYNTLKATMVEYASGSTTIVTSDGTTITIGGSAATDVTNSDAAGSTYNNTADSKTQFCEQYFPTLKLHAATQDDFGRPGETWTYGSTTVGFYAATPVATYTAATTTGAIYTALGLTASTTVTNTYTNGVAATSSTTLASGGTTTVGGNGTLVEVYNVDGTIFIVKIETFVTTIASVTAASGTTPASVTLTAGGTYATEGYAVGDVVLYTKALTATGPDVTVIKSVVLATKVANVKATIVTSTGATIGGVAYGYSAKCGTTLDGTAAATFTTAYNLYLDKYGYIIAIEDYSTAVVTNYAYVLAKDSASAGLFGGTAYYAKLLLTDGSVITAELVENETVAAGNLVTYTVTDGKYDLSADVGTAVTGASTITKGKINFAIGATNLKANSKTIFLVESGTTTKTYAAYVGFDAVPTLTGTATVDYVASSGYVTIIFVSGATAAGTSTTAGDVTFIAAGGTHDIIYTPDIAYTTYNAVVGGVITTITVKSDVSITDYAFVKSVTKNAAGIVTALGDDITATEKTGTAKYADGILKLGDTDYTVAADCPIYKVATDGTISVLALSAIAADNNDLAVFTLAADNQTITSLYIIVANPV